MLSFTDCDMLSYNEVLLKKIKPQFFWNEEFSDSRWQSYMILFCLVRTQFSLFCAFDNVLLSNVLRPKYLSLSLWSSYGKVWKLRTTRLEIKQPLSPHTGGFGCDITGRRWKRSSLQSVNKVCFSGELALAAWSFDRKNLAWASGTRQTYQH